MTKIDETGFMAALMVVNGEWTYFPTTATDREVTLRKAIGAYEAAKQPVQSSLGKRVMYEDGTPSREYEEQPDNSIAARIEWSKAMTKNNPIEKLLPCPFCGGPGVEVGGNPVFVMCGGPHGFDSRCPCSRVQTTKDLWNTRRTKTEMAENKDLFKEILEALGSFGIDLTTEEQMHIDGIIKRTKG